MFYPGDLVGVLQDLHVEPDKIQLVISSLTDSSDELDEGSFQRLHIAPTAFGGSPSGHELGFHHGKAHAVISDTIAGVVADLVRFRDGVQDAVRLVETADETSAADLRRKQSAVELLVGASGYSAGDRRNRESRNENLAPGRDEQ